MFAFSLRKRIKSFGFALSGIKILIGEEHNARIHIVVSIVVVATGIMFHVSTLEWLVLVFAIGFVLATEAINTAIENIADFVSPEKNQAIKKIKDLSASGVLISSLAAVVIGLIIFIPKVIELC